MWRHLGKMSVLLLLSGAILAVVMYFVGFEKAWHAVLQAGLAAFVSTGLCIALLTVLQASAWAMLNRGVGHRAPFLVLVEAIIVAHAGNILTPTSYLGGEPARILYVGKRTGLSWGGLTGTVLLGKYLEAISFVAVLLLCEAAMIVHYWDSLFHGSGLVIGLSMLTVLILLVGMAVALLMTLQRGWTPLAGVLYLGERIGIFPKALRRLRRRTIGVEKQASQVFRSENQLVVPATMVYAATHVLMFVKPMVFFLLGFRIGLDVYELSLIFVTSQVLLAFQLTPSGVGTLDGGMFGMISLAGIAITSPQCAAYLLSLRLWDLVIIAVGAALAAHAGAELLAKAPKTAPPAAVGAMGDQRDKP